MGMSVEIFVLRDNRLHEIDELRDFRKPCIPIRRRTLHTPPAKNCGKDKAIACLNSDS